VEAAHRHVDSVSREGGAQTSFYQRVSSVTCRNSNDAVRRADGSTQDKLQVAKAEAHALKADRDNNSIEGNKISIF
jgi:hypothetical protein